MTTTKLFDLALQAYHELQPEIEQAGLLGHAPPLLSLAQVIGSLGSRPRDALLLGAAMDGLPVLLDLSDPTPNPLLVMGERGSGKTPLLQLLARSVDLLQETGDAQFAVITNFPEEWEGGGSEQSSAMTTSSASMGVWPAYHGATAQFIHDMASWAKSSISSRHIRIMLIDDLAALTSATLDVQEDLRWLLVSGPERHLWTVATLNAVRAVRQRSWIELFPTHIFGCIHQPVIAESLSGEAVAGLTGLVPGLQFKLKQNTGWLQFYLPAPK